MSRALWFDVGAFAYAHRGLWDAARAENSLAAFEAAAAAGAGCELDVRATRDDKLVVFHDATLMRLCGDPRVVSELTLAELREQRLPDCSRIPTLGMCLEAMSGQPTLVEIKVEPPYRDIADLVVAEMRGSDAKAAVMSFDAEVMHQVARELAGRPVGQLIEPLDQLGETGVRDKALRALGAGCTYLAPHISSLAATRRAAPDAPMVCWTVRTTGELALARRHGAAPIFEGVCAALAKDERAPI